MNTGPYRLLLIAFALAVCTPEQADAQDRSADRLSSTLIAVSHQGRERTALVYVPSSYSASAPAPLVLMFHGGGGNAANAVRTAQMQAQAERHGLIVAYPDGTGVLKGTLLTWNAWNCCGYAMQNDVDDVGFARELIAALKSRYFIDSKRIYAAGLSNGGMMSYRLACELSDQIAAIAPVAGALNTDSCAPRDPVSVVIFHGTDDQHVLYQGGINKKRFPGSEPRADRSTAHAFSTWSRLNSCHPQPSTQVATDVTKTACTGGTNGAEVVLYTIEGQGHAWPGGAPGLRNGNVDRPTQQISATDTMIEFFLKHPKR